MQQLMFIGSWMDEQKVDWCTFLNQGGKEVTIGLPSEYFVELRNRYGCDLQCVCRLALEEMPHWPTTGEPFLIDGKIYLKVTAALKRWEFRTEALKESTAPLVEHVIEALTRHLNRLHGESWEVFYTDRYAPNAHKGETEGSRFVFRRKKSALAESRV